MSQRRRLLGSARFTALASYRNPPRSAAAASCRATRTAMCQCVLTIVQHDKSPREVPDLNLPSIQASTSYANP